MNIFEILEGLISSVPEAIALYQKVVPLIAPKAGAGAQIAEIAAEAPAVHAVVQAAHDAIATLVDAHVVDPAAPPAT